MTTRELKRRAVEFVKEFERPDAAKIAALITDDFEYELMTRMPGVHTRFNRDEALSDFVGMLNRMAPNGMTFAVGKVICDGEDVVVEAESKAILVNNRPYNNRYLFHLEFRGDKVARMREYCDTNHIREAFMA